MLSKRELGAIRKVLPKDGYSRIAVKTGYDTSTVGKALRDPRHFNQGIIETALLVIEEYKLEVAALKNKVKVVTA